MEKETISNSNSDLFLSRIECNMMRGLAIILIVLNNFGHTINGVHPDNEFNYSYVVYIFKWLWIGSKI